MASSRAARFTKRIARRVTPSFDDVADVVAEVTGLDRARITPASRLEQDLGVTGDDGLELLEALAGKFGTRFERPDHGGRYLFQGEGVDPISLLVRHLLGWQGAQVIPI